MVKSIDGGSSFEKPITLDDQNCVCCQTASAVGPDKEIYFAWRDLQYENNTRLVNPENPYNYGYGNGTLFDDFNYSNHETIRDIVVRHTIDGGGGGGEEDGYKFSPTYKVSKDKWYMASCPDAGPGMSFDSNGRLHIAWFTGSTTASHGLGFYYAYSDDKGKTFSQPTPLLTDKDFIPPTQVSLETDNKNRVWITFADQRDPDIVRYSPINDYHPGKIHLTIIEQDQQIIFNDTIIEGRINELVDITTGPQNSAFIAYRDGEEAKIASIIL